ncbi:BAG family molecular chaperone regulator 6 [Magnolia sinica]|uniref:BAG family molecular chaperone regulator 6 n=1 Tax=Magnolia sinica TaxID=86752 RepID=UPI00265A0C16|nr:BAG family molecular chaperone regulator 6 [Magnolia sinica]XP_058100298.1 BAG family molecular chaperone regulator 6 [Magnolia sinica]
MYPVYSYMDSFPQTHSHPRNHIPYPHHYYPSWETIPPQMKIDPSEPPTTFKSWPYNGSFGYPQTTECHSFCNHSYPSGFYSFRPPHAHPSPPPPLYYHGPYPLYPDAFPTYFVPPHHPAEQARYEYDKNMGRDRCCGCPNHASDRKAESNVKIEEARPDVEQKDNDSAGGLTKMPNHPYPIIWVPPGYMKDEKSSKLPETDPKAWNGWVPLDLNSIKSLKWGGEEKGNRDQQTEDKITNLPFPIIWMPGYDKAKEVEKKDLNDINVSPNFTEEPPKSKIIPVKLLENGDRGDKPWVAEEILGGVDSSAVPAKETKPKSNPPKQIEDSRETQPPETTTRSIPVKHVEEKKSSDNIAKKASKLPPVCLRVDPLPKKKNGNGNSRSPSPPGVKDRRPQDSKPKEPVLDKPKEGEPKKKEPKVVEVQENKVVQSNEGNQALKPKEPVLDKAEEREPKKKEIKVVEVQEKAAAPTYDVKEGLKEKAMKVVEVENKKSVLTDIAKQELSKEKAAEPRVEAEENKMTETGKGGAKKEDEVQSQVGVHTDSAEAVLDRSVTETAEIGERKHASEEGKGTVDAAEVKTGEEMEKMELSTTDAAVLIQSTYRGFEVRKLEPLKKLRQIVKVREQVGNVRERIRRLEVSSDMQQDEKQRLVIGETIMNLLLQLDTIQGLHPSVREVRKSVARELVFLQEKLDSLATQTSAGPTSTVAEVMPMKIASEDRHRAAGDVSSSMVTESTSEPDASVDPPTAGRVVSDSGKIEEVVVPPTVEKEVLEIEQTLQSPLVENEGPVSKQEPSVEPSSSAVADISGSGNEKPEMLAVENGRLDAVVEVLVEPPPPVNEDSNSALEESVRLALVKDEMVDSAVEGSIVIAARDEMHGSGAEMPKEVPPVQKDEEPALKTEEFTEPPSVKESIVESLSNLAETSKLPNSMPEESEEPPSVKDVHEREDALGTRELLVEAVPMVKNEELSSKLGGMIELLLEKSGEIESGASREPAGNAVAEPPPVQTEKEVDSNPDELPALSEISSPGVDSVADADAPCSELAALDVTAPVNDVEKAKGGGERLEVKTAVLVTEDTISAENAQDQLLELEFTKNRSAEPAEVGVEDKPSASVTAEAPVAQVESPSSEAAIVEVESPLAESLSAPKEELSVAVDAELRTEDEKPMGGTENLKEMLEKLIEAGKQQLTVISDLNSRVRDLERKLTKKKKLKVRRQLVVGSAFKAVDGRMGERAVVTAV